MLKKSCNVGFPDLAVIIIEFVVLGFLIFFKICL